MAIVCGTDLSAHALEGLTAALAVASRRHDKDIVLVHVIDSDQVGADSDLDTKALANAAQKRIDNDATRLAAGMPIQVRGTVVVGPALPTLITSTQTEGSDLLVVSAKGHTDSTLDKIGSFAAGIAASANVPLLVVRDAAPFVAWAKGERPLRVMIGLDESASCEPAIAQIKRLRESGPVDVVIAHVYYADETARRYGLRSHSMVDADPALEKLLKRDLERRLGNLPGDGSVTFYAQHGLGRIGDHLLEIADAANTDVILIGTRQKGGLGRLSSVSSRVLHDAKQSVWCVPATGHLGRLDVPRFRVAVVATDLSEFGNHAIPYGYTLVGERGGEVHLVHVRDEAHEGVDPLVLQSRLVALVPPNQTSVVSTAHVLTGDDTARIIGEAAERFGADVVVVASRGRSGLTRALLGSVADQVLRTCSRPVLVLRPPTE